MLTPVDRVFTRLGARDSIFAGHSTFYVELMEASDILRMATPHSLVIMDELGRGTSTFDGAAIAYAVLRHLADRVRCRTLFSTHYHTLVASFSGAAGVALGHMRCIVESDEEGAERVTFLYTLGAGACPKSHGMNVARLARLPADLVALATAKSAELEAALSKWDPSVACVDKALGAAAGDEEVRQARLRAAWELARALTGK